MFVSNRVPLICLLALLTLFPEADLLAQQPPDGPFVGLNTEAVGNQQGVRVTYVFPGSAAESMGLKIGDEILLLNDVRIPTPSALSSELRGENIGATLRMVILRDGKRQSIKGKIGSRAKTMKTFQERMRKSMMGKPLPPPPAVTWWNKTDKSWEDRPEAMKHHKGHLSVMFSFDGCKACRNYRLNRFSAMARVLEQTPSAQLVDFRGLYFRETESKEASLKSAQALFEAAQPVFPVGAAYYEKTAPTPASRIKNVLLHHHGVAILDGNGNVAYLQTHGFPEREFYAAYQQLLSTSQESSKTKPPGQTGKSP